MATKTNLPNKGSEEHVELLRHQVYDVLSVMESNVKALSEREAKIDGLLEHGEKIEKDAKLFKTLANENKKKQMWANYKFMVILCIVLLIVIIVVIVAYYYGSDDSNSKTVNDANVDKKNKG